MTRLLVTGASGHLGQAVLRNLIEAEDVDPADIVAGSRMPGRLAAWAEKGVETRTIDFDDPNLAGWISGVDRMLIISTDKLDEPGVRLAQHKAAVAAAKEAGVAHLLYTSMPSPDDTLIPFAPDHFGTEEAIGASGIAYTILRNSWYMENLLRALPAALQSGKWYSAAGDGRVGQVAREDCARAAAAALATSGSGQAIYTITGPEALSAADIAATASEVLGRPIEAVRLTDEERRQSLVSAGLPEPAADLYATFDTNTRLGKIDIVTDDVEKLTGSPPMTLREFLAANSAALAG